MMCRVVVHTANLTRDDVEYKTQGAYCQDFPLKGMMAATTGTDDAGKNGGGGPKKTNNAAIENPYKRKRVQVIGERKGVPTSTKRGGGGGSPFDDEDDDTPFEDDLVTYLESYRYTTRQTWFANAGVNNASSSGGGGGGGGGFDNNDKPTTWLSLLRLYDYSSAYVVLIPSVPGQHGSDVYGDFGYLKLRRAIAENVCPRRPDGGMGTAAAVPIVCQFSSIGSLNKLWLDRFLSAIDSSSTLRYDPIKDHDRAKKGEGDAAKTMPPPPLSSRMKIVWPTVEEIRTSVEGYDAGHAIPGRVANLDKDFLRPLYHRWSSNNNNGGGGGEDPFKTARHAPHIKSYVQPSSASGDNDIEWFVLSSHNLSIAAWGQLQKPPAQSRKDDKVLFMCNWELGVFMSPATLAKANHPAVADKTVRLVAYPGPSSSVINVDDSDDDENNEDSTTVIILPIPYDVNPTPYDAGDVFWAVDRDYYG
jgi:tyrosyl-DNA phosphodiesterase-1